MNENKFNWIKISINNNKSIKIKILMIKMKNNKIFNKIPKIIIKNKIQIKLI